MRSFCKHGHELTPSNTYVDPRGRRECRTCRAARAVSGARRRSHTHCWRGHEFDAENTYVDPKGNRRCRTCKAMSRRHSPPGATGSITMGADLPKLDAAMRAVARDPYSWARQAACSDMPKDMFFPERGHNEEIREAVDVCGGCPVRYQCLAANIHEDYGVFGGVTTRARETILRDLKRWRRSKVAA